MKLLPLPSSLVALFKTAPAAAALLAGLCVAGAARAGAGNTTFSIGVQAVVLPLTRLTILRNPSAVAVAGEDIGKGYVDADPSVIEIRTNSPHCCVLTLDAAASPFVNAEVSFSGRQILINGQGGMIVVPVLGRKILSMHYRFLLPRGAAPGVYPWPYVLTVSPLP